MPEIKVRDLMTEELITLSESENLNLAEQVMQLGRVRHLPVVKDGMLVGLVTHRDLLRAQVSALAELSRAERHEIQAQIRVGDIMTRQVQTIEPDAPAVEAARRMIKLRLGCIPVVRDEQLVGIITEADFLELAVRALTHDN